MIIINYIIVCLIFGTTFLSIKLGIEAGLSPFFSGGIRFLSAGLLVLLYFYVKGFRNWRLLFHKNIIFFGFCSTFMTFACLYWAEQHVTSGMGAILSATGPIMILLIQHLTKKATLQKDQLASFAISFIGVICICVPSLSQDTSMYWLIGCAVIVFGEIFYGLGSITSKEIMNKQTTVSPFLINSIQMCYGGIFLLLLSFFVESPSLSMFDSWKAIASILYLTLIGSIVGHGLYTWLVAKTNPVFPSTWLYISPIIASILGFIVLDETIKPIMVIGGILVLLGVFFANRQALFDYWKQRRRQKHTHHIEPKVQVK